jgi:hypothetical protein
MFRRSQKALTTATTRYPNGTFIETEKGFFYILNPTKRYRIISQRVLNSWNPHRVVKTTEAAVSKYRISAKLKFRNGSLIWNISDGKIYLIEDGKRRWLKNPDWFNILGLDPTDLKFNMSKIQHVSADEISLHELGEDLA